MSTIQNRIMTTILISIVSIVTGRAQQARPDSLAALREFAQLGQMYQHPSVRLLIHLEQTSNLPSETASKMETDMELFYGKPDLYMQAEGLEEIVNDSLVVMVNKPAKRMMVSHHDRGISSSIERTISMFMPDSSLQVLSKRFISQVQDAGDGKKLLTLTSRESVYATGIPRETVRILYHSSSYVVEEFKQIKTNLVPVDSAAFGQFEKEKGSQGKLISSPAGKGRLYFTAKESVITCHFDKVEYDLRRPPVTEGDRVEKAADGTYKPAKGFEDYVLTSQL